MAQTVKIGVIGTGVGVAHIEAFGQLPEVTVTAVCSARETRAQEIAARFGIPLATADYRDVLSAGRCRCGRHRHPTGAPPVDGPGYAGGGQTPPLRKAAHA